MNLATLEARIGDRVRATRPDSRDALWGIVDAVRRELTNEELETLADEQPWLSEPGFCGDSRLQAIGGNLYEHLMGHAMGAYRAA